MKKKIITGFIISVMALSTLCACKPSEVTDSIPSISIGGDGEFKACEGEWTAICEEGDEYRSILSDYYQSFTCKVYKEDGAYRMDFDKQEGEGSSLEIYGSKKLELEKGALYEGCQNQDWYTLVFEKGSEVYHVAYYMTLLDKDTLEILQKIDTNYEEYGHETYSYHYYFKKSDSDLAAAEDSYRYRDVITVSTVQELYQALGSDRRIILKEGVYNISDLTEADKSRDDKAVGFRCVYNYDESGDYEYYAVDEQQIFMYDARNLLIEGEEGANVEIVTSDPYAAPFAFDSSMKITLKNLTLGHDVEPGICSGAVLNFNSSTDIALDNLRMYGCGTYGIFATSTYNVDVTNCDIYECSYGLLYLESCSSWYITDTTLRDTKGFAMLEFPYSNSLYFTNCTFTGNNSISNSTDTPFIDASSYNGSVLFEDCKFTNNVYNEFVIEPKPSEEDEYYCTDPVEFNNCEIEPSK